MSKGTFAALVLLLASAPADSAIPTNFNLEGFTGTDVRLDSYLDCGVLTCQIGYEIWSKLLDTAFEVDWVDNQGNTLVSARQDPTILFGGNGQGLGWSWWRSKPVPTPVALIGEARFTPGLGGNRPCGLNYNCPADYLDWPSLLPNPMPETGPGSDDEEEVAENKSRLDRLIPLTPIDEPTIDFTTEEIIEYTSRVSFTSGLFRYTYTVENKLDKPLPYTWADAALAGVLDPLATATHSFTSSLAPQTIRSLASVQLDAGLFGSAGKTVTGVHALLAPVPMSLALQPGALGLLALIGRRTRRD